MLPNLISDIHKVILDTNHKVNPQNLKDFKKSVGDALKDWMEDGRDEKPHLRMSMIGQPDRKIWFSITKPELIGSFDARMLLTFLTGHIQEALLIFFIKEAGYEVTCEQKEVTIDGVKGHLDLKVNGFPLDVKTASKYAFSKKFISLDALKKNDDYGYIHQISAYIQAENDTAGGILAISKDSCDMSLVWIDEFEVRSTKDRIKYLKSLLLEPTPPAALCYEPIEEDNGNKRIDKRCEWCPFKKECFNSLRVFKYSDGLHYFSHIEKEPRVEEVK